MRQPHPHRGWGLILFTTPAGALPPKQRRLRGRRLVVVDIENVAGGAIVDGLLAADSRSRVDHAFVRRPTDHVIVGTCHIGLLHAGLAWPGARVVVRSGTDGADLALLDVLINEQIHERFDEVALVSGDGIFVEAVAELENLGVHVTVVSDPECCSKRLRLAAGGVAWLPTAVPNLEVAA